MLRWPVRGLVLKNRGLLQQNSYYSTSGVKLPEKADVVIIGGGSVGCNTFYQLAKRNVKVVLVERAKITSGTTWHTAGLVWSLRPSDVEIELLTATKNVLKNLKGETGLETGFINNGGLFIAHTEERMKEYSRLSTLGHVFNIESQMMDSEEACKIFPLLDSKDFIGGLYSPQDGCVDPSMFCSALVKGASNKGGQLVENCSVKNIIAAPEGSIRRVAGVETSLGTIKTNCVVNSTGVWGRDIAKILGLDLPLIPMKHAYIVSESIKGVKGLPNVRDHDYSMYFRIQGDSICMGGYELNPEIVAEVPKDFQFSLYDLDYNIFNEHVSNAIKLCPPFEKAGIKSTVCGPESFTPDHKPLMGEDPRVAGLFHACGFNSAGMMFGGGCGEQLAIWITEGRPSLSMYTFDIRRFTPSMRTDNIWARQQSHESYLKNYSIVFPHDERLAGRNIMRDAFHDDLLQRGAVMEQRQGWERPGYFLKNDQAPVMAYDWYGSYNFRVNEDKRYEKALENDYTFDFPKHHDLIGEEALACRNRAALFDISYFTKMYMTGAEAQEAADWVFTANTRKDPDRVVYTCALNSRGGVEADVTVTALREGLGTLVGPILKRRGYYIVAGGGSGYQTLIHLKTAIEKKKFKCVINDVTDKMGILSIQGPKSGEILQALTESPITDAEFPFLMSKIIKIDGHVCRALRVSFVGELGYELHIPIASCMAIYNRVQVIGKSFDMRNAGYRALYSLSCEKGYHLWNYDLRSDDNPIEANLGGICRKNAEYLGKRAVDKKRAEGLTKQRAFFTMDDKIPLWGQETVWRDDHIVGFLRRGEYGYSLDQSIGIGYVSHPKGKVLTADYLKKGSYEIEVMGKKYPAKLHLNSPFDPKNQRPLGIYEQQESDHFED